MTETAKPLNKKKITEVIPEEIMIRDVITFDGGVTTRQAIQILLDKKISGAPIVDGMKRVVSVCSEFDLIKFAAANEWDLKLATLMSKLPSLDKLVTVKRDDPFPGLLKQFFTHKVRRVFVVDDSGRLIGTISRRDIMRAFLEHKQDESTSS